MKDILQSDKKLEPSDRMELEEIMELSLETYQEGETCMRRLEAFIARLGHSEDAKILEKQQEINEIKDTDLYSLVAKLKLIFSLLGLYKMDLKLKKRKNAIAEVKDMMKDTHDDLDERLRKLEGKVKK